jgi:hypothetical protein
MQSKLRDNIEELNRSFAKKTKPSESLRGEISRSCKKRYLFDIIYAFQHIKGKVSSKTIEAVTDLFPRSHQKWAWVLLCALRPPYEDPINWVPHDYDFHYHLIMLNLLKRLDLSSKGFRSLAEYPLRTSVDNLLMSGAFWGCGTEVVQEWLTKEFYDDLLARENDFDVQAKYLPMEFTEHFISAVARLFERHRLERMHLGISAAVSYYGGDKALDNAKCNFIEWLLSKGVNPILFELVVTGFLIPANGLLLPNDKQIYESLNGTNATYKGVFGMVNLGKPIKGLANLLKGGKPPRDKLTNAFLSDYIQWHQSLHLTDRLGRHLQRRLD